MIINYAHTVLMKEKMNADSVGDHTLHGKALHSIFPLNLFLACLVQTSKIPRGLNIYYFLLILGRLRRSAKQLINQVKL